MLGPELEKYVNENGYKALRTLNKKYFDCCALSEYILIGDVCWNELYNIDIYLRSYKHEDNFNFNYKIGDKPLDFITDDEFYEIKDEKDLKHANSVVYENINDVEFQLAVKLKYHLDELKIANNIEDSDSDSDSDSDEDLDEIIETTNEIIDNYDNYCKIFKHLSIQIPKRDEFRKMIEKLSNKDDKDDKEVKSNKCGNYIKEIIDDLCSSNYGYNNFGFFMPKIKAIIHSEEFNEAGRTVEYTINVSLYNHKNECVIDMSGEYCGDRDSSDSSRIEINGHYYKGDKFDSFKKLEYIEVIKKIMREFDFVEESNNMDCVTYFNRILLHMLSQNWKYDAEKYVSYLNVSCYFDINDKLPNNKEFNNINWYASKKDDLLVEENN
jgi:hypothetical protein